METRNIFWASLIIAIAATLLSGLYNSTPGGGFVGATWYGWPTAWAYNYVTYPPSSGYSILNFVVDIVAWTGIAMIVICLGDSMRK